MNDLERERERRKQKALERLGTNNPVCVLCEETDWRCLELHHVAGKEFHGALATVCRNCHRKLSDMQKDHPKPIASQPDPFESLGHFLLGLADLFQLLVAKLREFGEIVFAQAGVRSATAEAVS